ncbi:Regulator of nonsense transcripts UPF3 [Acorus calamus]|uniref:Regulator of nonsense transcripts UPF3 n=1 Tax=Acorus calamus TaxID=4465 RepID=A0AAV9EDL2_ACOCL|nr:Regulator of nonsense transcripts UPF3 [Acorus calamus]
MKDPSERTKVVVRRLPPTLSRSALMEQIDGRFSGRYKWFSFRPGKISQKNQRYSRAYIDFKKSEDVVEFAEFFDGHVFVNEKGAQCRALVEYAPSQRIPKWPKKDGREGSIFKDPEYLEFLDLIAKPAENLPSAEVQLERREAERAGGAKETIIVTPLMDFVRQKRAAKRRSSSNGKLSRRMGVSSSTSSTGSSKRASEKRRVATSMYVLRDSIKKDKPTYILMPRQEDKQFSEKPVSAAAPGSETLEEQTAGTSGAAPGVSGTTETGKKRYILLKGKGKEASHASGGSLQQEAPNPSVRNTPVSVSSKQNQRSEVSGRVIRSILMNKEARHNQSQSSAMQAEQSILSNLEKDKRPPRPPNLRSILKDQFSSISISASTSNSDKRRVMDDKALGNNIHGEKQDRRTRNKDRPDRGVWAPLRCSDGLHVSDESLSSSCSQQDLYDSLEVMSISQQVPGNDENRIQNARPGHGSNLSSCSDVSSSHGETKVDMPTASWSGEVKGLAGGRSTHSSVENGSQSHRHIGRRGSTHGYKDADVSLSQSEGKSLKKGGAIGYGSHEKQVWVQKSGSGS